MHPILFSLVVDNFGIKEYVGKHHAAHLYKALEENYEAPCNWEGKLHCGVTLHWIISSATASATQTQPPMVQSSILPRFSETSCLQRQKPKLWPYSSTQNKATVMCTTLTEKGHEQPATPIQTNNSTANGIINGMVE
jgi:hypothetical protein